MFCFSDNSSDGERPNQEVEDDELSDDDITEDDMTMISDDEILPLHSIPFRGLFYYH